TCDLLLEARRRLEVSVGEAAPFSRHRDDVLAAGVVLMQRVVEARDHPRAVLKRPMLGGLLYPLAVDPDLATVVETVEIFAARIGQDLHRRPCSVIVRGGAVHLRHAFLPMGPWSS